MDDLATTEPHAPPLSTALSAAQLRRTGTDPRGRCRKLSFADICFATQTRNLIGAGIDLEGEFPRAAQIWQNLNQVPKIAEAFAENGGTVQRSEKDIKPEDRDVGNLKAKL